MALLQWVYMAIAKPIRVTAPYPPPRAIPPGYLGMRPSMQPGFHLRRVGGTVMVPEHFDGRIRPGELKSGAYGYYYKGSQKPSVQRDPLEDLQ